MKHMSFYLLGENYYISQINHHTVANYIPESYIHFPLESRSSINETEGNSLVNEISPLSTKCGLQPILFYYQDLVVA